MTKRISCFLIAINCVISTVIETPQNTVIHAGQRLSLKCETVNGSYVREWIVKRSPDSPYVKIFINWRKIDLPSVNSGYGFDVNEYGSGELYSNDTQLRHAGKYTCITEARQMPAEYYAELNVLESEPVCNVTEYTYDKPSLKVQCFVKFSGNLDPKIEWIHTHFLVTKTYSEGSTGSGYTYTLEAVIKDHKNFVLSFRLHFGPRPSSEYAASNIPNFTYVWSFKGNDGKSESVTNPGHEDRLVSYSSIRPGFENQTSEETTRITNMHFEDKPLSYVVVSLTLALILTVVGFLAYYFYKRNEKTKLLGTNFADEERRTADEIGIVQPGVYENIQSAAIGNDTTPSSVRESNRIDEPVVNGQTFDRESNIKKQNMYMPF